MTGLEKDEKYTSTQVVLVLKGIPEPRIEKKYAHRIKIQIKSKDIGLDKVIKINSSISKISSYQIDIVMIKVSEHLLLI